MSIQTTEPEETPKGVGRDLVSLALPGGLLWLVMAGLAYVSRDFQYFTPLEKCPTRLAFGLLSVAFVISLWSIHVAIKKKVTSLTSIFVFAIGLRLLMIMTTPILEIDIYRYMWDGLVVGEGVSPYSYSPHEVLTSSPWSPNKDLAKLASLRSVSEGVDLTLQRIHFKEITTVYPPVSQAVFAVAGKTTPDSFVVEHRLATTKVWLVLFDLGTLLIVGLLLREVGKPMGWAIAYGWSPLVLKEFANSGHLDSIAVFFSILAVWLLVRKGRYNLPHFAGALFALALGVGAKLFPIVLLPLFLMRAWHHLGFWRATGLGVVFLCVSGAIISPMFLERTEPDVAQNSVPAVDPNMPPLPTITPEEPDESQEKAKPKEVGLTAFLSRWEMNDFLFSVTFENVRPVGNREPGQQSWFALVPDAQRVQLCNKVSETFGLPLGLTPFLIARALTSAVFLGIAVCLAIANRGTSPERALECAFLTLAWFWLLSPTQNPWYWAWALPLVAFARNRLWLLISGTAMIYYLRFWFRTKEHELLIDGLPYNGTQFFDQFMPCLEFGPILAMILVMWIIRIARGDRTTAEPRPA